MAVKSVDQNATDEEQTSQFNPRERFRSFMTDEAKVEALRQLADGGPEAISVNAIAKKLGMSGPALYRYFASRDALVTELVADAYHDLAVALATATGTQSRNRPAALASAYRGWALDQPHRYRLLFRAPMPGYEPHVDRLVNEAQLAMNVLLDVLSGVATPEPHPPKNLSRELVRWAKSRGVPGTPPPVALQAIHIWERMHGHVSLEIEDNFQSMGLDPELIYQSALPELFRSPNEVSTLT
jgi:AcrR family transcriptional regulator